MKKYLLGLIMVALISGLLPSGVLVYAQETPASPTLSQTETNADSLSSTRENRIIEYKKKSKNRISSSEQSKLMTVCVASQLNIKSLTSRVNNFSSRRIRTYDDVNSKLSGFQETLKIAGVDTYSLEASLVEIRAMTQKFTTDLDNYQTTLTDMYEMDCEADPVAFKSAVESARIQRSDLKVQSDAIKAYITQSIVPVLKNIKTDLSADNKTMEDN